jgi:hypothetical protein
MYEDEENNGRFPDTSPQCKRDGTSCEQPRQVISLDSAVPRRRCYRSAGSRRKASKRRLSGVTARK